MPHKTLEARRAYARKWRDANRERFREYGRRWKARNPEKVRLQARLRTRKWVNANPEHYLYVRAKHRAKAFKLPFNLEREDIRIPDVCPVLGLKLELGKGRHAPESPSVDRMYPEKGYVRGNVFVISFRANTLKRNATLAEMKAVVRYMERNA